MSCSISDTFWEEIKIIIPVKTIRVGRSETDLKKSIDVILWIFKTGAQWLSIVCIIVPYIRICRIV